MADSARRGKRDEALSRFDEAEKRLREAAAPAGLAGGNGPAPGPGAPPTAPGQAPPPGAGGLPGIPEAQAQQMLQGMAMGISHELSQATDPEQRRLLERAQALQGELGAALQKKRDLRPVLPYVKKLGDAYKAHDYARVERILDGIHAAIPKLPPAPAAAAPGASAGPAAPPPGPAPGPGGPPAGSPPHLPPVGLMPGPGGPGGIAPEKMLQALDSIRKMPEADYQRQRPLIGVYLAQAVGGGFAGPAGRPAAPTPAMGIGDAASLRVELGKNGEIIGVRGKGKDLTEGLPAGGFALQHGEGSEVPIRMAMKLVGKTLSGQAAGPEGTVSAAYRQDGQDVVIQTRVSRDKSGKAGELVLRLPVRAAGWRWGAGDDAPVIAVEGAYSLPNGDPKAESVTLRGGGVRLTVAAPGAASVQYDPAGGWLTVRFPVSADKGAAEHTVRLAAGAPTLRAPWWLRGCQLHQVAGLGAAVARPHRVPLGIHGHRLRAGGALDVGDQPYPQSVSSTTETTPVLLPQ